MSGAVVLLATTSGTTAPTWWAVLLDSSVASALVGLIGVLVGLGSSAFGAWLVRRDADKAAKVAAEAETQARYRLQARRLLEAVAGLQEVVRGLPMRAGTSTVYVERQKRALAALRKAEARHWDMVLDCPDRLKGPADDLLRSTLALYMEYAGDTSDNSHNPYTMDDFGKAARAYFTGEDVSDN